MNIKFEYPDGATPIDDISGLKISWVKTQSDLNRVEAENISQALEKHLMKSVNSPLNWFNIRNLKKIHKEMFQKVWDWAGGFRTTQTIPGVKPYQIQDALKDLCDDVHYWNSKGCEMTFLEQSARIHHRLVFIHPFLNGNGRFSRIIADRYLKAWKCAFPIWPREMHNDTQTRKQYILSLKSADFSDYNLLIDFMKKYGAKDLALCELLRNDFYKKITNKNILIKIIKAYIRQGCNVNESTNGHYPLQLAVKHGLKEIVSMFIQAGANILNKDKSGFTAFEIAIANNYLNIAKILYDHGYPYMPKQPLTPKLLKYHSQIYKFDRKYF